MEDRTTMMNLYKAGEVDATVQPHRAGGVGRSSATDRKIYMDKPECAIDYYMLNTTKAPMDDVRVRKAFNMAIDKVGLAAYKRTAQAADRVLARRHLSRLSAARSATRSIRRARKQLLAEAGYRDASGNFDPAKFPIAEVELTYNTNETQPPDCRVRAGAVEAEPRPDGAAQEHGVEDVPRLSREAPIQGRCPRPGWVGDYMDPYTFLDLFCTNGGDNGTGWSTPEFVAAARRGEPRARIRRSDTSCWRRPRAMLLDAQPVIPLFTQLDQLAEETLRQGHVPESRHAARLEVRVHRARPAKWD